MLGFCCSCCRSVWKCSLETFDAVTNLALGDFDVTREELDAWTGEPDGMVLFILATEDLTRGEVLPGWLRGQWWCSTALAPEMGE